MFTAFNPDPYELDPIASFNRVRLVDLPGAKVDDGLRDRPAYDALGAPAIVSTVRAQASVLKLPPGLPDREVLPWFQSCVTSEDAGLRAAAARICAGRGRLLGHLLLTLKTGANPAARPDWGEAHWRHWAGIEHVVLGGGLMRGAFGGAMTDGVRAYLDDHGCPMSVEVSRYGAYLPSIGVTRFAPPQALSGLVVDFGGTEVKRGLATYDNGDSGRLVSFEALATLPSGIDPSWPATKEVAESVWKQMWAAITTSWPDGVDALLVAIACHLEKGAPVARGAYGSLVHVAPHLEGFVARTVADWQGRQVFTRVVHDGTAGAAAYAGALRTAVLTLGSAAGIGFPPPAEGLRPVALGFAFSAGQGGIARRLRRVSDPHRTM